MDINIIPVEVTKKLYRDAAAPAAKEIGGLGGDITKMLRLFMFPIQFAATWQDRLKAYLDEVRAGVPEERQVEAAPAIACKVLEELRFVDETSPLKAMYLELLKRAIDKDRQSEAHPSFPSIITQLARDEAVLLQRISTGEVQFYARENPLEIVPDSGAVSSVSCPLGFPPAPKQGETRLPRFDDIVSVTLHKSDFTFPERLGVYLSHLVSLLLIEVHFGDEFGQGSVSVEPATTDDEDGFTYISPYRIVLTPFGKLFVSACVPGTTISDQKAVPPSFWREDLP